MSEVFDVSPVGKKTTKTVLPKCTFPTWAVICGTCGEPVKHYEAKENIGDAHDELFAEWVHMDCAESARLQAEVKSTIYLPPPICNAGKKKPQQEKKIEIRAFESGATRDTDAAKFDLEGFLSPLVLEAYAEYMNFNRHMKDGSIRASDNWQKGMPLSCYMKSGWRHFFDWWKEHRGLSSRDGMVTALCGLLFNVMGYLHEYLKENKDA